MRILDNICLYFLFFIWRRQSETSKTFLISLYNINDVRDLIPSRHSAIHTYFNLIFKSGKICQVLRSFGTSKHQETKFVHSPFHVRCPVICISVRVTVHFKLSVCIPENTIIIHELIFKSYLTIRD